MSIQVHYLPSYTDTLRSGYMMIIIKSLLIEGFFVHNIYSK